MMCYKDTTFCSGGKPRCASFGKCFRALTDKVRADAKRANMPIMQFTNPERVECYIKPCQK